MIIESIDRQSITEYDQLIYLISSGRKEKSIKKTLHYRIQQAISERGIYNYFLDYQTKP